MELSTNDYCWYRIWEVENEGRKNDFKPVPSFRVLFLTFLTVKNNCTALHTFQISASTILQMFSLENQSLK